MPNHRNETPSVSRHDALRLRLFRAHGDGRAAFERERDRIKRRYSFSVCQIAAIWARGRGAFQREFLARVLSATPPAQRPARRRELTALCRAARA